MEKSNYRILVVDDESSFLLLLTKILEGEGYSVKATTNPEDAMEITASFSPNLVITDLKMPQMDGITLMEKIKASGTEADFIVLTAFATVETAVSALKKGAVDYITKPLKAPEELRIVVAKAFERQAILNENILLREEQFHDMPPLDIMFCGMEHILREVRDVAPTNAAVMLYGETGTGKSLIAKVIHHMSGRPGPFVDINCAAIPETLLESELFGYEKGAFTGAISQKKGKFEFSNDGTLFLDEVSEMSPALQVKLLKVLQEKTFERLGSVASIRTSARIIAATNKDLKAMVSEGKFREDLFYRLNVFPVNVPPLRERKDSLSTIAAYLTKVISARLGKGPKFILNEVLQRMAEYPWPGNIRELENIIERSTIVSRTKELVIPQLEPLAGSQKMQAGDLKTIERGAIESALLETGGNRTKAAELLGISLRTLQYKIKEYRIKAKR